MKSGSRGEAYVVVQVILFMLMIFAPQPGWTLWPAAEAWLARPLGIALLFTGAGFVTGGARKLGRNLTPLPRPRDEAVLVTSGAYKFVRHPIYIGLVLGIGGWGLFANSAIDILYAVLAFGFFDVKSRREEIWLEQKFPDYPEYRRKTRKLLPFIY